MRIHPFVSGTVILAIVLLVFATGCGRRIPKASSAKVKNEVLNIARGYYNDQVAAVSYQKVSGIPIGVLGIKVDYAWLFEHMSDDPNAEKALTVTNDFMHTVKFSLQNLVTDEVDKEVGKISCRCDVMANDRTDAISFTAQYTEDGELYVAVYGLGDEE